MNTYPRFNYSIVKQGVANTHSIVLGNDVSDVNRTLINKYELAEVQLQFFTLCIESWFVSELDLSEYMTYSLILTLPDSIIPLGQVSTAGSAFTNKIVLSSYLNTEF